MVDEKMTIDVNTVAEMVDVPVSSAKKLMAKKNVDFPKSFKVGKHRRWLREVVIAYMNGDPNARA